MSVSTDTVFVHKAWHDNSPSIKKITYPMAADPTVQLCRYFGTYIEGVGLSLRGTFIIDPDGALKAMDIHDNSICRSAEEILRSSRPPVSCASTRAKSVPRAGNRERKP